MKFPSLVPDKVCNTPVTVYREDGLNRDGSPKRTVIFEGKCFYKEKTKHKITADKQLITLSGDFSTAISLPIQTISPEKFGF